MTSKEFARLLGVSQSTVSRALNGSHLVPDDKKAFIRHKARELGFELNRQAQSLKTNRTGTVGILFQKHFKSMNENPMLAHLYDHIQRELIANAYDVMTIYDRGDRDGLSVLERIVRRRKVDGIITFRSALSDSEAQLIQQSGFPCVSLLNVRRASADMHYCLSDIEHGGWLAGDFFGRFPDYVPMYLTMGEEPDNAELQCRGFRRGLAEHGVTLADGEIRRCDLSFSSAYAFASGMKETFRRHRTAILAYNDLIARGVAEALKDNGIAVPGTVQIIGMDDIPMSVWMRPHLSTLHVPVEEMVPVGCRMLRDLIEGRKDGEYTTSFQPRLVLRDTTVNPE